MYTLHPCDANDSALRLQDLSAMTFRFKDKERPRSYSSSCASVIHVSLLPWQQQIYIQTIQMVKLCSLLIYYLKLMLVPVNRIGEDHFGQ